MITGTVNGEPISESVTLEDAPTIDGATDVVATSASSSTPNTDEIPKFFDWPNTIEQTLKQQTDIRLLVVFLGPNDPWDFPKGKKYLKFASPEWSEEYLSHVNHILTTTEQC